MPYIPSVFDTDLYETIANKLNKSEKKRLEKELVRVETEQAGTTARLWDDIYRQACQIVIITRGGRKFVLKGSGWTDNVVSQLPSPVAPAKPPRYDSFDGLSLKI